MIIPKMSVSFDDDSLCERLADWCIWGPFELAATKPKVVRLLAILCWPLWFFALLPVLMVCAAILVWREI